MKNLQHIRKVDGIVQDREKLLRWFNKYLDKMSDGEQIIEFDDVERTQAQNRYYWVILGIMAQSFGTTPNELHEYFKAEYLPQQEYFTLIRLRKLTSTTEQTKDQMTNYLERVIQFAAEQGIMIPDIEEYKHNN